MGIISMIAQQLLWPGVIGMILGYWLLGTKVSNDHNILGQEPWSLLGAVVTGGVVIGFAIWFLVGLVIGFNLA